MEEEMIDWKHQQCELVDHLFQLEVENLIARYVIGLAIEADDDGEVEAEWMCLFNIGG